MPDKDDQSDQPHRSIEDIAAAEAMRRWNYNTKEPIQLSLEVQAHPEMDNEPWLVGSLKLKGDVPVRRDLNTGDRLTVQIVDADGQVVGSGIAELDLPKFKHIKGRGVGLIGIERAHTAEFVWD